MRRREAEKDDRYWFNYQQVLSKLDVFCSNNVFTLSVASSVLVGLSILYSTGSLDDFSSWLSAESEPVILGARTVMEEYEETSGNVTKVPQAVLVQTAVTVYLKNLVGWAFTKLRNEPNATERNALYENVKIYTTEQENLRLGGNMSKWLKDELENHKFNVSVGNIGARHALKNPEVVDAYLRNDKARTTHSNWQRLRRTSHSTPGWLVSALTAYRCHSPDDILLLAVRQSSASTRSSGRQSPPPKRRCST